MLLPQSVFTHGQLYTGYSRTGDSKTTFVWANQAEFEQLKNEGELDTTKTYTRNIVYEEILDRRGEMIRQPKINNVSFLLHPLGLAEQSEASTSYFLCCLLLSAR